MVDAISNALSGLQSAGIRAGVSANNIANLQTVGAKTPDRGPAAYVPQDVVATAIPAGGVATHVQDRAPATVTAYDPDHPYADDQGAVDVPNINLETEIVNLKIAEIAYKASANVIKTARAMQDDLLKTFDEKA